MKTYSVFEKYFPVTAQSLVAKEERGHTTASSRATSAIWTNFIYRYREGIEAVLDVSGAFMKLKDLY